MLLPTALKRGAVGKSNQGGSGATNADGHGRGVLAPLDPRRLPDSANLPEARIGALGAQLKAFWNSGMFETTPFTR